MPDFQLPALYVDEARSVAETDRPLLINRDPSPLETGVPRSPVICLELVDLLDPPSGIDAGNTTVWINGDLAWDDDAPEPGFNGPGTDQTQDARSCRICIEPETTYASEQVITVRVISQTNDASAIDQTYTFTIEDYLAPALAAATATGRREVALSFVEAVEVVDGTGFTFERIGAPGVSLAAVSATADGTSVVVVVDKDMTPGIEYRVTATGVQDLADNPPVAPTNEATFTGYQMQAPATRRFLLWDFIPLQNRRDDASGDLARFIAVLQEVVDLLLCDIDAFCSIWSIEDAPSNFVDLILGDLGNPFDFDLDETRKRRLAAALVDLYKQKGTEQGIIDAVNFFLGILVSIDTIRETGLELGLNDLAWPAFDETGVAPFDTEDGRTIEVVVNGGDTQEVVFNAADVVDIDAITAEEAIAIFNAQLVGVIAVAADGGTVQLRTVEQSPTATLQVVGGTAFAAFGFSGNLSTGGGDFVLGSDDRRLLYSFRVVSPVALTDEQREQIAAIAEYLKPAHTHLIEVADPPADEVLDHWLLGLSDLGEETDLH